AVAATSTGDGGGEGPRRLGPDQRHRRDEEDREDDVDRPTRPFVLDESAETGAARGPRRRRPDADVREGDADDRYSRGPGKRGWQERSHRRDREHPRLRIHPLEREA